MKKLTKALSEFQQECPVIVKAQKDTITVTQICRLYSKRLTRYCISMV
jgi:hypothetical protein